MDTERRIIFVMGNRGKMQEIRPILAGLGLPIPSMKEAGVEPEIVEDGTTPGESTEIEARAVQNLTGDTVLADDSGLEVDYIDGEPGIYSAQHLGEDIPYEVKNRNTVERLKEAMEQECGARFVCSIAAVLPDGRVLHIEAVMEGLIAGEPVENGGFGYDPILYLPQFGKTSAEITMEQKNKISRRGRALRAMKETLEDMPKQEMERTKGEDINYQ